MSNLLEYDGVRLPREQWIDLAKECIAEEIGDCITDVVEFALEYARKHDGGGFLNPDDISNYYGPTNIDDWTRADCIKWLIEKGVDEEKWPSHFIVLLDEVMQYIVDSPKNTLREACAWVGLPDDLAENISPWVTMEMRCSVISRINMMNAMIDRADDVLRDHDSVYEWRDTVRDNWGQEVNQWWTCTEWFANMAERLGQCTGRLEYTWFWGRTDGGQLMEADEALYPIWALRAQSLGYI